MLIRLGTRNSALARWQAEWVAAQLGPQGVDVELVPITTTGDRQQESVKTIGAQGLFTKEIQRALLDERIDLAVHSLKDLPTDDVPGLTLAAVPRRAAVADVFVSKKYRSLDDLPAAATVGTGSLRRKAQMLHLRPDLNVCDIRGNVDTRLKKLADGQFDAILLAEAGLRRLGLDDAITQVLPPEKLLSAVGQGALGLETRTDDTTTRTAVATLDDCAAHRAVIAERTLLAALQGGCLAPIAAWARIESYVLTLSGRVLSADGRKCLDVTLGREPALAVDLGQIVAEMLLNEGAAGLIEASRHSTI